MTKTETFELNKKFEGFTGIEDIPSSTHYIEEIGVKFNKLSLDETKEWCKTLDNVFSKHFQEKGIDFIAALNSLSNKS